MMNLVCKMMNFVLQVMIFVFKIALAQFVNVNYLYLFGAMCTEFRFFSTEFR